jgi:hypothetical protein
VNQEGKAPEHRLLGQAALTLNGTSDPIRKLIVVRCHRRRTRTVHVVPHEDVARVAAAAFVPSADNAWAVSRFIGHGW